MSTATVTFSDDEPKPRRVPDPKLVGMLIAGLLGVAIAAKKRLSSTA